MDKAATTGSARSFGAAVGAKTKEFINDSTGSGMSGTSRDENLPQSKFNPKYERPVDKINKHSLKHPVRPDGESVAEMVKEAAHKCALRKALTKDKDKDDVGFDPLGVKTVAAHLQKNWGKYALGAGGLATIVGIIMHRKSKKAEKEAEEEAKRKEREIRALNRMARATESS